MPFASTRKSTSPSQTNRPIATMTQELPAPDTAPTATNTPPSHDTAPTSSSNTPPPSEPASPESKPEKIIGCVLDNPQLVLDWDAIKDKVHSMLESVEATKGFMTCISLSRLGYDRDSQKNPITVYVSVEEEVPEKAMSEVSADIQAYLDTLPYELTVHMEHNYVEHLFCID